eukprot:TRINITY_DN15083_c0_g2_i3.p1 TRINITY_DN15083_c0_g2~~TRINITY_DN15083_c0_g2_i3.p1  ORF type:complete len:116 (+),score=35.16 TRINITY_DN15083_c0_g2_i3:119-466(+)
MSGQCTEKKRKELVRRSELAAQSKKKSRGSSEVVKRLQSYGKMYEERRAEQTKDPDFTFKPSLNHKKNVKIGARYMNKTPNGKRKGDNENLTFKPKICKMSSIIANNLVLPFSIT